LLVALFVLLASPAGAIVAAGVVTLAGTLVVARGTAMRSWRRKPGDAHTSGLGPLRVPGFRSLLVCVCGLGYAFGAAGVVVPAFANAAGSNHADSVGGLLLAIWAVGSASGGVWFGTRDAAPVLTRQLGWLLAAVGATLALFSVMPNPAALGIALLLGGATIGPALTVENSLVSRIVPGGMLNEAYTWVVTVSIAASSAGSSLSGVIVDRPGGVPWAFLLAGAAVMAGALVAGRRSGALRRADAHASGRVQDMAAEPA
jgi:hypothetical protein